jgi:transcriptional regulator with XRE-family HTH domain
MFEIFERLMRQRGETFSDVARAIGVSPSTFTDWRAGRYTPKADKMQKIADHFGVNVEYLLTGRDTEKESMSGGKYYFSDETAQLAQDLFDDPDLRILFDAARGCTPKQLNLAAQILRGFKETNPDG